MHFCESRRVRERRLLDVRVYYVLKYYFIEIAGARRRAGSRVAARRQRVKRASSKEKRATLFFCVSRPSIIIRSGKGWECSVCAWSQNRSAPGRRAPAAPAAHTARLSGNSVELSVEISTRLVQTITHTVCHLLALQQRRTDRPPTPRASPSEAPSEPQLNGDAVEKGMHHTVRLPELSLSNEVNGPHRLEGC